jgi:hypothetical protein
MAVFTYREFIREGREVHKEKRNDRSPIDTPAGFSLRASSHSSRINSFEQYQQKKALRPFFVTV